MAPSYEIFLNYLSRNIAPESTISSRYRLRFVLARNSRDFIAACADLELRGSRLSAHLLISRSFVNLALLLRQRLDRSPQQRLQSAHGLRRVSADSPLRRQLHSVFLQRRELQDRQQRLALFQLPAHSPPNLRQPRTKRYPNPAADRGSGTPSAALRSTRLRRPHDCRTLA